MTRWVFSLTLATLALLPTAFAPAQDAVVSQLYGNGVHAYFSGNPFDAYDLLTASIQAQGNDPRAYYFRGLALSQMGRWDEARNDFRAAAKLEALDSSKFYDVSRALERVQGSARLSIERYRTQARVLALKDRNDRRRRRYEELYQDEPSVTIEEGAPAEAPAAPATPPPAETPSTPPADDDPFAEPAAPGEDMPAEEPAAEQPAAEDDPFATPPAEEAPPENPPAETPPAENPQAEEDPFGTPAADQPAVEEGNPAEAPSVEQPPETELPPDADPVP